MTTLKAPIYSLLVLLVHPTIAVDTVTKASESLPVVAPIVDLSQLHLPATPLEWAQLLCYVLGFVLLRRSDKRSMQRQVRLGVRHHLGTLAATSPKLAKVLGICPDLDAKRLPKSAVRRKVSASVAIARRIVAKSKKPVTDV